MSENTFMNQLRETILSSSANLTRTENGAFGYASTGKALLDLNFAVSSLRGKPAEETIRMFEAAYNENRHLAIAWLFFARDIRGGGMGERRLFRICLEHLSRTDPQTVRAVLPLIPEYGRWDDMIIPLVGTPLEDDMMEQICVQLMNDRKNCDAGKPISLLAKWLPSYNASSEKKRHIAARIARHFGASPAQYKATLSKLRRHLGVVECRMSENRWSEINYSHVPSRANLNYNRAFLRHDEVRRRAYLGSLKKGEAKINASAVYPHEIVSRYRNAAGRYGSVWKMKHDETFEAMWDALPDYTGGRGDTLVVADGSGSMSCTLPGTKAMTALDVSNALAIYFATHMPGVFHNQYITFSSRPSIVHLTEGDTLHSHIREAWSHTECSNTDIERTFELILKTAVYNEMKQEDLPKNVLVISDMEFDRGTTGVSKSLFQSISNRFAACGYKLPRLVFWNVNSRSGAIPLRNNDLGVCLVSGYSPAIAKMVLSGELDPYKALVDAVTGVRYEPVWAALASGKRAA